MTRRQYLEFDAPVHQREAVLRVFYSRGWKRDGLDQPISSPKMADSTPWVRLSLSREAPSAPAKSMRETFGL
jgi:hypothetical protein